MVFYDEAVEKFCYCKVTNNFLIGYYPPQFNNC